MEHANEYDTGTGAMIARGESWVLKRMAVGVERYPGYGERLRVETWSSGISGSKGYRDFRVFAGGDEVVIRGSSLWVYVSMAARSIVPIPREVADGFPSDPEGIFCPNLEDLVLAGPRQDAADVLTVSLRYSDFDANDHVNNAAYADVLQTGLASLGRPVRPRNIRIKYGRGIPAETTGVEVRLASLVDGAGCSFSIARGASLFAQGDLA
ncbi:MAG: hypothetical protein EHM13_09240 [Acidobacteria bacterium]|nr:MAG: hypothetical protein EHM13_09240 [Acidobacteriota bacterium]